MRKNAVGDNDVLCVIWHKQDMGNHKTVGEMQRVDLFLLPCEWEDPQSSTWTEYISVASGTTELGPC